MLVRFRCINPEGTDIVYPAPGDQVFYGGKYSEGSPPVRLNQVLNLRSQLIEIAWNSLLLVQIVPITTTRRSSLSRILEVVVVQQEEEGEVALRNRLRNPMMDQKKREEETRNRVRLKEAEALLLLRARRLRVLQRVELREEVVHLEARKMRMKTKNREEVVLLQQCVSQSSFCMFKLLLT